MFRVLLWLAGCVFAVWLVAHLRLETLARDLAILGLATLWIIGGAAALARGSERRRAQEDLLRKQQKEMEEFWARHQKLEADKPKAGAP